MFKVTRVQSRPNLEVEFWRENHPLVSESIQAYRQENYVQTGKFVSKTQEFSPDGLIRTTTTVWSSQDALNEFLADPRIIAEFDTPGDQYMRENGIVTISRSSETI